MFNIFYFSSEFLLSSG